MGARALPLAVAATAIFGLSGAPAGGQDPAPAPPAPGCAGQAFLDPRGDQVDDPLGLGFGPRGTDNVDITGGFFRFDGGLVTANIQIADLTAEVPALATGLSYYMYYTVSGALHFVSAESDGETVFFSYGTLDRNTGLFTTSGETRGRIFPGPGGVIQIEVPEAAGGKAGTILAGPYAEADNQTLLLVSPADQAPDSLRGASYAVGECLEGAAAPPPAPQRVLPFRAPRVIGSAARANRSKSLAFRVRATQTISDLRVALRARDGKGRAFASGRLRRLRGTATLRMRVLRKLRRGTYALQAKGTVAGQSATTARRVTLRP